MSLNNINKSFMHIGQIFIRQISRVHNDWSNNDGFSRGEIENYLEDQVACNTCITYTHQKQRLFDYSIYQLYYYILCNYSTLTVFTTAFGIWYLCAAADRHNDPVTLRETTSTLAVPPITRAPRRRRAHYRRRTRKSPPYLRRRR